MLTKICKKCGIELPLTSFHKSPTNKFGVATICIECKSHLTPEKKAENKLRDELFNMGIKKCHKCGENKPLSEFYIDRARRDGYKDTCKLCTQAYENAEGRRQRRNAQKREYNKTEAGRNVTKKRQEQESYKQYNRDYKKRDYVKIKEKERRRKKEKENVNFRLAIRIHSRLNFALKGTQKDRANHKTEELIGCTISFYRAHIESQFTEGMSWDNWTYSGWHLEHIIPCKAFNLKDPIQKMACFNWRNMRPLWGKLNLSKGWKYNKEDFDNYMKLFI